MFLLVVDFVSCYGSQLNLDNRWAFAALAVMVRICTIITASLAAYWLCVTYPDMQAALPSQAVFDGVQHRQGTTSM